VAKSCCLCRYTMFDSVAHSDLSLKTSAVLRQLDADTNAAATTVNRVIPPLPFVIPPRRTYAVAVAVLYRLARPRKGTNVPLFVSVEGIRQHRRRSMVRFSRSGHDSPSWTTFGVRSASGFVLCEPTKTSLKKNWPNGPVFTGPTSAVLSAVSGTSV
jgi:hypothetical protein